MIRTLDQIPCPVCHAPVTRQPVASQPVTSGSPGLGGHISLPHPSPLPILLLAMLLLTSLAGCAMNDGDKMALTSSEQSAAPDVAMIEIEDNTITFGIGVGMTGPIRVVAVTHSNSIPASSYDYVYIEYLARQKIAEWRQTAQSVQPSSPQLEARLRAARHISQSRADPGLNGTGETATDWTETTRITPQEPASRADLIVRRLSPDGQTAPTVLKVIQE